MTVFLNVKEVADRLRAKKSLAYNLLKSGVIPSYRWYIPDLLEIQYSIDFMAQSAMNNELRQSDTDNKSVRRRILVNEADLLAYLNTCKRQGGLITSFPMDTFPHLLTVNEVAVRLRLHRSSVYKMLEENVFPNYRLAGGFSYRGAWRVAETDLDAFITKCRWQGVEVGGPSLNGITPEGQKSLGC